MGVQPVLAVCASFLVGASACATRPRAPADDHEARPPPRAPPPVEAVRPGTFVPLPLVTGCGTRVVRPEQSERSGASEVAGEPVRQKPSVRVIREGRPSVIECSDHHTRSMTASEKRQQCVMSNQAWREIVLPLTACAPGQTCEAVQDMDGTEGLGCGLVAPAEALEATQEFVWLGRCSRVLLDCQWPIVRVSAPAAGKCVRGLCVPQSWPEADDPADWKKRERFCSRNQNPR